MDILLAKSLLSGNGFRDIWMPDNPVDNWRQPGFPALIAFLFSIFGQDYLIVKIFISLLTCAVTVFLYLIFKSELKQELWLFLLLFITNGAILEFSHYELTEIPYLFTVVLTFYFWKKQNIWGTLLGLLSAYYVRTDAVMLFAGFMVFFLTMKNWRRLFLFGTIFPLGVLPWIYRSLQIGGGRQMKVFLLKNEYFPDRGTIGFSDLISRMAENFRYYFLSDGGVVVFNFSSYLTILIMGLSVWGLLRLARASEFGRLILIFVLFHILLFLFWQSSAHYYRYYIAIAPFLMLGFFFGFNWCINRIRRVF